MAACSIPSSSLPLHAIVVTKDPEVVRFWRRVLDEFGISHVSCDRPEIAVERLAKARFDVIVVDCQSIFTGAQVITTARSAGSNVNACVIALFGPEKGFQSTLGANFVLPKPVAFRWAVQCVRSAYASITRGHRRHCRHRVQITAQYRHKGEPKQAIIQDISEDGIGLLGAGGLFPSETIELTFTLVAGADPIQVTGRVVWASKTGTSGIQITAMSAEHRRRLLAGLQALFEREQSLVEMTEPVVP
jgi:DNA-binding NarL/FixJ family response regulator